MIVADVSFIDIFWSMLWFFFLFIWIVILAHIVGDLFRDHSLSGVTKTLWCNGDATPTEQTAQAKELLDAGTIDRSEFDRLKAKALA